MELVDMLDLKSSPIRVQVQALVRVNYKAILSNVRNVTYGDTFHDFVNLHNVVSKYVWFEIWCRCTINV